MRRIPTMRTSSSTICWKPEVIGAITSAVGYANAVPASREFIAKDINEDPVVYPPAGR